MNKFACAAFAACVVALGAQNVAAQKAQSFASSFPVKPVRMIVPLAPGGGSDIVGRIVAQGLTTHWGKSVVVDNRPGAGSAVGTSIAAKAAADGYTLLVSSSSIAITPVLYKNLDFDVRRDFTGITLIASQPSMLVVNPSVPAANVKELIALGKSGKLSYASAGVGSATHLGTELFLYTAGTRMLHVPYKSAGLATSAVLSGEAQVLLTNMASVLPHLASGKLRPIGVSSLRRSDAAPQVPTLSESGLTRFEYVTWYGMLAPARTDASIVRSIHASVSQVLKQQDTSELFTRQGLQTYGSAPTEFEQYLHGEIERWAKVVSAAEIRAD